MEREFGNGKKRNGKANENNNRDDLLFEDEYLNGEKNGKGKEFNARKKLIFEGEFLNGKKWNGKGKKYDYINGELKYNKY